MMASLLHISLNGPNHNAEDCKEMLTEATKVWRKTHFRNLPSLKKLPMFGGSDHEGSLHHQATKTGVGIHVEFPDYLHISRSEAQEDGEESMETELDAQVQVVAQAVARNADLCHDALDAMDMADVESGVDSDFEFEMDDD